MCVCVRVYACMRESVQVTVENKPTPTPVKVMVKVANGYITTQIQKCETHNIVEANTTHLMLY